MEKIICCIHGCKKEVCQTAYCEEHEEEFNEEEIRKPERKQTLKEVLDFCNKEYEAKKDLKDFDDIGYYLNGIIFVEEYLEEEIKKLEEGEA